MPNPGSGISRRRDGRWSISVSGAGRRLRATRPAHWTRAQVIELRDRLRADLARAAAGGRPVVALGAACERYLMSAEAAGAKALRATANHLAQLAPHIGERPCEAAPDIWAAYRAAHDHHLAPATIRQRGAILQRVLRLAERWGWCTPGIAGRIELPAVRNARHLYLSREDVCLLAACCPDVRGMAAIVIAAWTGLRLGEIASLNAPGSRNTAGPQRISLYTTKTGRPRVVPIVSDVVREAIAWLPLGVHPRTIEAWFERARTGAALEHVTFHDLRHTCASLLLGAGVPLEVIGQILGHSSTQTTRRYAHLAEEIAAAALRRLG